MNSARTLRGFSLVEVAIALGVGTPLLMAIYSVGTSSANLIGTTNSVIRIEERTRVTLDRVGRELWTSDLELLDPKLFNPLSADRLTFQKVIGFNGALVLGPVTRIAFELDPNEKEDGLDNDGDELIDEGRVVWIENPGQVDERRVVYCEHVRSYLEGEFPNGIDDNGNGLIDERGLCFDFVGDIVNIRLTLEGPDHRGRLMTRSVDTSLLIEN